MDPSGVRRGPCWSEPAKPMSETVRVAAEKGAMTTSLAGTTGSLKTPHQ